MGTVSSHTLISNSANDIHYRAAMRTDVGLRRTQNQDSYGYLIASNASLYVVCDGMGGARGGATASALAVNMIVEGAISKEGDLSPKRLTKAIQSANRLIFSRAQSDNQLTGMGTTVVALAVMNEKIVIAHVGDSRIYMWRGGELKQLTRDHTLVQELVDTGAIERGEAAAHPIAHMLTRSLGPADSINVEMHHLPDSLQAGDRFVLCSDGLYNHVSNEEIARIVSVGGPEQAAEQLVKSALQGGGSDNVTVEVIEVVSGRDEVQAQNAIKKFVSSEVDVDTSDALFNKELSALQDLSEENLKIQDSKAAGQEFPFENPIQEQGNFDFSSAGQAQPQSYQQNVRSGFADIFRNSAMRAIGAITALAVVFFVIFGKSSPLPNKKDPFSKIATEEKKLVEEKLAWNVKPEEPSPVVDVPKEVELSEESVAQAFPKKETEKNGNLPADYEIALSSPESEGDTPAASSPEVATSASVEIPKDIQELLDEADSLKIPAAPQVAFEKTDSKPTDPIVWEHEDAKIQQLQQQKSAPVTAVTKESVQPTLRVPEETAQLVKKKREIRDRISDLDLKLDLLLLKNKEEAHAKQVRLEMENVRTSKAITRLREKIETLKNQQKKWTELHEKRQSLEALNLADDVALLDSQVKSLKTRYNQATEQYLSAVENWQASSGDSEKASEMARLGREVKKIRGDLEAATMQAIEKGSSPVSDGALSLERYVDGLDEYRGRLNRHIGYVRAFHLLSVDRKRSMRDKHLQERASLMQNIRELQQLLSDEDEKEFLKNYSLPS